MRKLLKTTRVMILAWTSSASAPAAWADVAAEGFRDAGLPATARQAWQATVLLETRTWRGGSAGMNATQTGVATGSGLVIDRDARTIWIATSSHVIRCPAACQVRAYLPEQGGGRVSAVAEPMWSDPRRDLALLRATAPRRAAVRVAMVAESSDIDHSAADVLAIGFPDLSILSNHPRQSGRRKQYSVGRLRGSLAGFGADYLPYGSARSEGRIELDRALTHDADLLPGSSGGPLIDASGRVLGINTGSLTSLGAESCAERRQDCRVHLAVPIDDLRQRIRTLQGSLGRD